MCDDYKCLLLDKLIAMQHQPASILVTLPLPKAPNQVDLGVQVQALNHKPGHVSKRARECTVCAADIRKTVMLSLKDVVRLCQALL